MGAGFEESGGTGGRSARRGWWLLTCWGLGNAAVIAGTLSATPALVDASVPLLLIALVIALLDTRGRPSGPRTARGRAVLWAYRALLMILIVSVPVGVVLAHLRNGS
jgi:hypothetical protein